MESVSDVKTPFADLLSARSPETQGDHAVERFMATPMPTRAMTPPATI